jgi:hypothetical protein
MVCLAAESILGTTTSYMLSEDFPKAESSLHLIWIAKLSEKISNIGLILTNIVFENCLPSEL